MDQSPGLMERRVPLLSQVMVPLLAALVPAVLWAMRVPAAAEASLWPPGAPGLPGELAPRLPIPITLLALLPALFIKAPIPTPAALPAVLGISSDPDPDSDTDTDTDPDPSPDPDPDPAADPATLSVCRSPKNPNDLQVPAFLFPVGSVVGAPAGFVP